MQQNFQEAAGGMPFLLGVGTAHSSPELSSRHGKLEEGVLLWSDALWQSTDESSRGVQPAYPSPFSRVRGLVKKKKKEGRCFVPVCVFILMA